ncbi:MAG: undecaprenyl-diphosphate phosphatase [Clostridia bacterium]|nr:undecaprenyl-diphosphate phosphatase [Clostridia bacterium]
MLFNLLKSALMGLVQGITEWLPVSSGGHLLILNALLPLKGITEDFWNLYDVVIQLGSILAVVVLYFRRLNPFAPSKSPAEKRDTWSLWFKIIVAVIPSGIVGVLLNDWIEARLNGAVTVAVALIVYGVIFLLLDRLEGGKHARRIGSIQGVSYKTAFLIGCFQVLALIPGTSRSGSTIIGALLLGLGRTAAVEFSFFMAIPTMAGASLLKCVKFVMNGGAMTGSEAAILAVGFVMAFAVSIVAIRALVNYIRTHSFRVFGIYRIILGAAVLALAASGLL